MRTGELYECVESPFSYSRSWGYTPSRILLYDGWLRHRLLNELFRSLKNSAFHRLSRSVNLEYYAFLVFSNLSNRNDSLLIKTGGVAGAKMYFFAPAGVGGGSPEGWSQGGSSLPHYSTLLFLE